MKRIRLILIVIFAAALLAAFFHGQTVRAEAIHHPEAVEAYRPEAGNPAVAAAVGLTASLFGGLTLLPLIRGEGWGAE